MQWVVDPQDIACDEDPATEHDAVKHADRRHDRPDQQCQLTAALPAHRSSRAASTTDEGCKGEM
jgi:hypothetical protein